jgi:hypothetical protein
VIKDRMPPLAADRMTPAQKKAAAELAAGPRGGVHGPFIPLLDRGVADAVAEGRRPRGMAEDEELAHDFCDELLRTHGVSDATYRSAVDRFGEQGVIDMLGLIGYFTTVSMVMNVARTPPPDDPSVSPLGVLPQ